MVYENNIPKTETIYELKSEIPSFEEFMRAYEYDDKVNYDDLTFSDISEVRGYGPCLCGCSCPKTKCDCNNPEFSIYKEGDWKIGNGTASGGIGLGGHSASGDVDFTLFRKTESNGEMKFGTFSAGVDVVDGGLGSHVKVSANVIDFKGDGVEVKAGINLDTGAGISSDGLELKVAGFGFTVGRKLEVSTIAGGVSVDCVIQ